MKVGIDKFVREERRMLRRFGKHWAEQHVVNPEQYPAELGWGEWVEQFNFWVEAESEKKCGDDKPRKVTHKEKRENVVNLAIVNPTLSMSAIARHYGYSEAFVAKVCKERGKEIIDAQLKNQNWRREEGREAR